MTFRDDAIVGAECSFQANGTAMKLGVGFIAVNDMLVAQAGYHGSCVNHCTNVVDVIFCPVVWIGNDARRVCVVKGRRRIVSIIDRGLVRIVEFINRIVGVSRVNF